MSNSLTPDPNAPSMGQWIMMRGAIEKCAMEMEALLLKYGKEVFAINLTIFLENMPEALVMQVERYRYLNSKLLGKNKIEKLFIPPVDPFSDPDSTKPLDNNE